MCMVHTININMYLLYCKYRHLPLAQVPQSCQAHGRASAEIRAEEGSLSLEKCLAGIWKECYYNMYAPWLAGIPVCFLLGML
jgi:hypothetical protein